jgi:cytosine/adenosine deaminase-related metal-dependent hydrolase
MMGLHAPFTLSDNSLQHIADRRPKDVPIHIHVAEDESDGEDARRRGYPGPLARLHSFGLLDEHSLVVHGVHLSDSEVALAKQLGVRIAHNPESNFNNRVGYADPNRFNKDQVVLGTDGMTSNILYSLRFAVMQESGLSRRNAGGMAWAPSILFENPRRFLSSLFNRPVGKIAAGLPADFAVFTCSTPTPVTNRNWFYHLIFGVADAGRASWVYANGMSVLENGKLTTADESGVYEKSRIIAEKVWARFKSLN